MTVSDDAFKAVETNTFVQNSCSPQPPDDPHFRGILINAPQVVWFRRGEKVGPFGTFAFIPICGFFRLDTENLPPFSGGFREAMRLVAQHRETGIEFTGPLVPGYERPTAPVPRVSEPSERADLPPGLAVGGYFNANLAECVRLLEMSAVYSIQVELGDRDSEGLISSNRVGVEIEELFS